MCFSMGGNSILSYLKRRRFLLLFGFYATTTIVAVGLYWHYFGDTLLSYIATDLDPCIDEFSEECLDVGNAILYLYVSTILFGYVLYCIFRIYSKGFLLSIPVYLASVLAVFVDYNAFREFYEIIGWRNSTPGGWLRYESESLSILKMFVWFIILASYFQLPGFYIVYRDFRRWWRWSSGKSNA